METKGKAICYKNLKVGIEGQEKDVFDIRINELEIKIEVNEHATFYLSGKLSNENKDSIIHELEGNVGLEIYYEKEEDTKTSLFNGIITNIEVCVMGDVYKLEIAGKSYSYLMDIHKKSRTFQNVNASIKSIVEHVMESYEDGDFIMEMEDRPIGELVVQYEETDWEFIKRLISKDNEGILNSVEVGRIAYFLGVPEIEFELQEEVTSYKICKNMSIFNDMKKNYIKDALEIDYIIYKLESYELLRLGNNIILNGHKFYVQSLIYKIEESLLCNYYSLQLKNGLRQKQLFNENIVGMSLLGNIIDIKRDTVKINFHIDGGENKEEVYYFKYSTMSASSDGSGWYCMPELGDQVRVYFPTKEEKESFSISCVSSYKPGKDAPNDRMSDPNVKYLRTIKDKEIQFNPSGIIINCNSGKGQINLNNDGTVNVVGQNDVHINASQSVNIIAEKSIIMTADEAIDIKCEKGGNILFTESGDVEIKGLEVKIN
jgi:hypothetical protein